MMIRGCAMLYFANPTGSAMNYMLDRTLGYIDTPLQGNKRPAGVIWCADNGCFNDHTFDEDRWWNWLVKHCGAVSDCVFATAPDVMGDHAATVVRSEPWLQRIRDLGYPAAFVAQDGSTPANIPWNDFDVLFVGGTNDFKLGSDAHAVILEAKSRKMWVHAGRINSRKRYRMFASSLYGPSLAGGTGCESCDGTYLVFGPKVNLPKLLSWIDEYKSCPELFDSEVAQ